MKLNQPWLHGMAGLVAAHGVHHWMRTLDFRVACYDPSVDATQWTGQSRIYVFWHETILFPLYARHHCRTAMLMSQHRDADLLERVAKLLGFDCVRGSSYRGGAKALRELAEFAETRNLAITPDGPRGPRRTLAPGAIFLASRLGLPIVPLGCGTNRPWRLPTWDRFVLPRPFARARGVLGPEVRVPANLDREGLEHYRLGMEKLLNSLTAEAEAWATAGTAKVGELPVVQQSARAEAIANWSARGELASGSLARSAA